MFAKAVTPPSSRAVSGLGLSCGLVVVGGSCHLVGFLGSKAGMGSRSVFCKQSPVAVTAGVLKGETWT